MLSDVETAVILDQLDSMKFFPAEPGPRVVVMRLLQRMVSEFAQAQWLVDRMADLYTEWPGLHEMRACFCSRFRPLDGINAYSTMYLDGIPSQDPIRQQQITGPQLPALPPGHIASADDSADAAFRILASVNAQIKSDPFKAPPTAEEIANAPKWLRRLEGFEGAPDAGTPQTEAPHRRTSEEHNRLVAELEVALEKLKKESR